jgi:cytoskeletal protein RodZ
MSNNPNHNEIFMPENKSNKASIIVAVVAICLILGGVYLINQGVSSTNKPKETAQTTTSNSSSSNTPSSSSNTSTTSSETQSSSTSTTPSTSTETNSNTTTTTTPAETPSTPAATTTPTTPAATTTPTTTTPKLESNQLTAKVLSISDAGETRFEIVECGLENAKVCKAGSKIILSGVKTTVGLTYLVSGSISEDGGVLTLENITVKEYKAA